MSRLWLLITFLLLFNLHCAAALAQQADVPPKVDRINRKARKKIVWMLERDQYWRMMCIGNGSDEKSPFCRKVEKIDRENTRELERIVARHGFPNADLIGSDIIGDVFTVIIHSRSLDFQKRNLSGLNEIAKTHPYKKPDIALLTDKILVAENKPQIYGTQFKFENGKMTLHPTTEPEKLDQRRAEMMLPPMAEYAKMLEEMYKMPVVFKRQ